MIERRDVREKGQRTEDRRARRKEGWMNGARDGHEAQLHTAMNLLYLARRTKSLVSTFSF